MRAIVSVVTVVLGMVVGINGQLAPGDLFAPVLGRSPGSEVSWPTRLARVDRGVLETARIQARSGTGALRLNLFDDVALEAGVALTAPASAGYSLSGRLRGVAGSMTLVVNRDLIAGTVRTPTTTYTIRSADDDLVTISSLPSSTLPWREEVLLLPPAPDRGTRRYLPIVAPVPTRVSASDAPVAGAEDGSRIDILVVYTPTARELAGGHDWLRTDIDLAVADVNWAYAASGVIQRLNVVLATEVDYVPHDNGFVNLERLQDPNDGHLDEVHAIRDRYAADIVTLEPGGRQQGAAYRRMEELSTDFAEYAFTSHGISGGGFAHEFGHIQGLSHDRYQTKQETTDDLAGRRPFPYSFGYVNQAAFEPDAVAAQGWWTIMAYNKQCRDREVFCGGVHLMRFSNPDQSFSWNPDHPGDPLGVPGDDPSSSIDGPADARRSLNETRHIVANFRRAPCLTDVAGVRLQASNGQFLSASRNGGDDVSATRDTTGTWEHFTLVDANGGCVETGDTVYFHTSDGFYLRAESGGGPESVVDARGTTAGQHEQFVVRRSTGTDIYIRAGDSVTLEAASGHYVVAEDGGGGSILADSESAGSWETFRVSTADWFRPSL